MNAEKLIYSILNSDEAPAYVAESFLEGSNIPSPIWIYNNTFTEKLRADDKVFAQNVEFVVAYYSDEPQNMREVVDNKCEELEQNGFICSGVYNFTNKHKPFFGLGFIATIQIQI